MNDTTINFDRVFKPLYKHPFLSVSGMCILLYFFGFSSKGSLTTFSYIYAGAVMMVILVLLIVFSGAGKRLKEAVCIFLTASVLTAGGLFLMRKFDNSPAVFLWLALFLLAAFCAVLWLTGKPDVRCFIMLIIAAGVVLRLTYDLYTGSLDRQYDVGAFNWTYGHANYIEYWYNNGLKLPGADKILTWQYYHPPLHHWLMAMMLRILTNVGMKYETACQSLQFLPFLYSSLMMVVSFRIFRIMRLKEVPLFIATAIICFHPTFLHLSGSFNNDALCALFMMASILTALKWYREPSLKRIIPVALCVGLGMMSKLSGWMVAPAIAVVFLYVFIKNIKSWKRFLGQYALFGAICVPLGLWWQVRSLILFDMPITYVPYSNIEMPMYCGNVPASDRLFDFGNGQLGFVYVAYTDPGFDAPFRDYNPTIGLFKTAVFSEGQHGISDIHFPQIEVTGPILFWIGVALGLLCFVAFIISMCSKKSGLDIAERAFFSVLALTMLGSYYVFCFKFPFTCTMNIRYCVPLIPIFVLGLGLLLRRASRDTLPGKILHIASYALTAAFAVMTCILYTQIALPFN